MPEEGREIVRERESTARSCLRAYCTAQVHLCFFLAQWEFLAAVLSKLCCVSSSVVNMNIHEAPLSSLVKASWCSTEAAGGGGDPESVFCHRFT